MTRALRFDLPLPPSVNSQYATVGRRRVLSSAARRYRRSVAAIVRDSFTQGRVSQGWVDAARGEPLACDIIFYFATPYRRDLDGGLKITLDALMDALGLDDRYIVSITLTKQIDPLNPRSEIELAPLDAWQFDETYIVLEERAGSGLGADAGGENDNRRDHDEERDDRDDDE